MSSKTTLRRALVAHLKDLKAHEKQLLNQIREWARQVSEIKTREDELEEQIESLLPSNDDSTPGIGSSDIMAVIRDAIESNKPEAKKVKKQEEQAETSPSVKTGSSIKEERQSKEGPSKRKKQTSNADKDSGAAARLLKRFTNEKFSAFMAILVRKIVHDFTLPAKLSSSVLQSIWKGFTETQTVTDDHSLVEKMEWTIRWVNLRRFRYTSLMGGEKQLQVSFFTSEHAIKYNVKRYIATEGDMELEDEMKDTIREFLREIARYVEEHDVGRLVSKKNAKEGSKEDSKEESKEESKDDSKEESKQDTKAKVAARKRKRSEEEDTETDDDRPHTEDKVVRPSPAKKQRLEKPAKEKQHSKEKESREEKTENKEEMESKNSSIGQDQRLALSEDQTTQELDTSGGVVSCHIYDPVLRKQKRTSVKEMTKKALSETTQTNTARSKNADTVEDSLSD